MGKYISFGDNQYSTGSRLYIGHGIKLSSWRDRRCMVCGRFVSKKNTKNRCNNCFKKHIKKYKEEWDKKHKQYLKEYYKDYDKNRRKI